MIPNHHLRIIRRKIFRQHYQFTLAAAYERARVWAKLFNQQS